MLSEFEALGGTLRKKTIATELQEGHRQRVARTARLTITLPQQEAQRSLPQTPVAAAALVFSYSSSVDWPRDSIHVIDENKARLGWPKSASNSSTETDVIRESDCAYRMEKTTWRGFARDWPRAQIDFSKLVSYQTQGRRVRLLGESGMWCNNYNGPSHVICFDSMGLHVHSVDDLSHILQAIKFIPGVLSVASAVLSGFGPNWR